MNDTVTTVTKTVLADMASRSVFNSIDDATAYLGKCAEDLGDFGDYPVVFAGSTPEGQFDPAVYTDAMQVAIVKLTEKGSNKEGAERPTVVKSIVIYPSPKPEAVIADESMTDWLAGIISKEANLVAMRPLRKAVTSAELLEAQNSMPLSLEDYRTSGRETTSGILETYNALWQLIKKTLGEKYRSFGVANLSKKELRKAMESSSYAAQVYPKLETRENKKGEPDSYFEKAIRFGVVLAGAEGLDSTVFERMLANRHETTYEVEDDADDAEIDFEAEAAKLLAAKNADDAGESNEG